MGENGIGIFLGFMYGWLLMGTAAYCGGFGQGSLIPAALSAAPLGFGGLQVALVGTPVFWTSVGYLAMRVDEVRFRRYLLSLLTTHLVSGACLVTLTPYGDWDRFFGNKELREFFVLWAIVYFLGHLVVWRKVVKFYGAARTR